MANILSKSGISNSNTIEAWHVSQSVDAFTGTTDYDITISGSLILTGSTNLSGSVTVTGGDLTTRGFSNATASWADNLVNLPSNINRYVAPSGSTPLIFSTQMVVGSGQINSGQTSTTIDVTPVDFNGKTLGIDVFVTVGISSSYATSSMGYFPRVHSLGPNDITFTTSASCPFDVPFFYTAIYKA